jgi:hypothetical protein
MDLFARLLREQTQPARVLAQEGFLDDMVVRMRQFFDRTERELDQEEIRADKTHVHADKLIELAEQKNGLVEDSLPLHLTAWAKWLVLDGEVVGDPDQLIRELDRLTALLKLFSGDWVASYTHALSEISGNIFKLAQHDPKQALEALKPIGVGYFPNSFNALMKQHEKIELQGKQVEARCSDKYLGIGTIRKAPWWWNPQEAFRVEVSDEGLKRTEPKKAEVIPFAPGQVVRVLQAVNRVLDAPEMRDMDKATAAQNAMMRAVLDYERKKGIKASTSETDAKKVGSIAWTFMFDFVVVQKLLQQTDHICQVVVKLCEGSLRRAK